jgi:hypothetical protein
VKVWGIAALLLPLSCGSSSGTNASASEPTSPLTGSFRGTSFSVSGAAAVARNGILGVSLANESFPCGDPFPGDGWIIVVISIPENLLSPGSYALGPSYMDPTVPGVGVARYAKSDAGLISTDSLLLDQGTLWITSVTSDRIQGGVTTAALDGTSVSGTFDSPICAPDGGVPDAG